MTSSKVEQLSPESLKYLLELAQHIATEYDIGDLCEILLNEAIAITKADGGTLHVLSKDREVLDFALFRNDSLDIYENLFHVGSDTEQKRFNPIPLYLDDHIENHSSPAAYSYHEQKIINIDNVYEHQGLNFTSFKEFDTTQKYHSESYLCVPIINKSSEVVGVFQLINACDDDGKSCPFSPKLENHIAVLSNFIASVLDKQLVLNQQRDLLIQLSGITETQPLLETILREAKFFTNAEGGSLYLLNEEKGQLEFSVVLNDGLDIDSTLDENGSIGLPPVPLHHLNGLEDYNHVVTAAVHSKEAINIKNVYDDTRYDLTGTHNFDQKFNYRSSSLLAVPLLNHEQDVIGVLQLLNARDIKSGDYIPFNNRGEQLVQAMGSYAAIALDNQLLIKGLKELLDAFIKCIAQAIDAKSSHTSSHCQRIPILTEMIAEAACEDDTIFRDFNLNEDEWYELNVAAWLHDCGKLSTPDSILEKATKLHLMSDGIDAIKARFACMHQEIEIKYYEAFTQNPDQKEQFEHIRNKKNEQLKGEFDFIYKCNIGSEYMSPDDQLRVQSIATQTWTDGFGQKNPLLTETEIENLCITKGTLTNAERSIINNHMQVTIDMLESLPFPKKLHRVPEYAGGHHEKMDGTGFPKGLTREEMSIPARMMAIADVFEALTSRDRPYKEPMKVSQALDIMTDMVKKNHLDPDIYKLFIESNVWQRYALQELASIQLDIEDYSYEPVSPLSLTQNDSQL